MSTGFDRSSYTPTNVPDNVGAKSDIDVSTLFDIVEAFETTTTPLCEIAERHGISYGELRDVMGRPTPTGDGVRERVTIASADETVLRPPTQGHHYHLPAADRDGPLCNNSGGDGKYEEKTPGVLPWYELCNRCAGMVIARTEAITSTEVIVDG